MLILGILLGQGYDWWSTGQLIFDKKERSTARELRHLYCDEPKVLTFLLAACGRVAKASGTVSVEQISYVEEVMMLLHFDSKARTTGISCFNQGKEQNFRFAALAKVCLQQPNSTPQRQTIMRCLCHVAVLQPGASALAELQRLGAMIGFSPSRVRKEYDGIFHQVHGPSKTSKTQQRHHARYTSPAQQNTQADSVAQAYAVLDLPTSADLKTVKTAYRRLVARYHPDRLGPQAGAQQYQYAQHRMVEIREAFEILEQHLN